SCAAMASRKGPSSSTSRRCLGFSGICRRAKILTQPRPGGEHRDELRGRIRRGGHCSEISHSPIPLHGGKSEVERKTISIMKACELVGVSRRTIYNWLSSGKIEYVRTAGGSVRIFVDTLWRDPNNSNHPRPAAQGMWQAEGRNQV